MCVPKSINATGGSTSSNSTSNCSNNSSRIKEQRLLLLEKAKAKAKASVKLNKCNDQLDDVLSISTYYTKVGINYVDDKFSKLADLNLIKFVLKKTTQPAHLITALGVSLAGAFLYPHKHHEPSTLLNFFYLLSFSIYIGTQIWMTFVSGLSLFFCLPRHHFGKVQQILFPKYFFLNTILTFITLGIFSYEHDLEFSENFDASIQMIVLGVSFVLNLLIRVYLTPPLLKLMLAKNAIEAEAGLGQEVGRNDFGVLLNCPHYRRLHSDFRRIHMTIAMGNIATMACSILHLAYISSKLCVI